MNCRGTSLSFGRETHIMGILNVTPDSFSDGGEYLNIDNAIEHAKNMIADGATIIDIGGESSRPGADPITANVELDRVIPLISELVSKKFNIPISIDTTKATVAKHALKTGAHIINDITALQGDPEMAKVAADTEAGVILMHMKGTPRTMQHTPYYQNVVKNIYDELKNRIKNASKSGINPKQIIIDPGIGFGKTTKHNIKILKQLNVFKQLNKPILIGTSRKSFIGNLLKLPVTERAEGTIATVCWAITHGADIVRVHDVKETARAAKITDTLYR